MFGFFFKLFFYIFLVTAILTILAEFAGVIAIVLVSAAGVP